MRVAPGAGAAIVAAVGWACRCRWTIAGTCRRAGSGVAVAVPGPIVVAGGARTVGRRRWWTVIHAAPVSGVISRISPCPGGGGPSPSPAPGGIVVPSPPGVVPIVGVAPWVIWPSPCVVVAVISVRVTGTEVDAQGCLRAGVVACVIARGISGIVDVGILLPMAGVDSLGGERLFRNLGVSETRKVFSGRHSLEILERNRIGCRGLVRAAAVILVDITGGAARRQVCPGCLVVADTVPRDICRPVVIIHSRSRPGLWGGGGLRWLGRYGLGCFFLRLWRVVIQVIVIITLGGRQHSGGA